VGKPPLAVLSLLTDFIIPNLESQPSWLVDQLVDFIFDKVPLAGKVELINTLSKIPFVPVGNRKSDASQKRIKPCEVVDTTSPISALYFDDEVVFPTGAYSAGGRYHQDLVRLGMKSHFDANVAAERIKTYHSRDEDAALFGKYKSLLTSLNGNVEVKEEWIPMIRLPAVKRDQNVVLFPSQCRPKSFAPLVDGVLGIVPIHMKESLETSFGWDGDLDPEIIGARIQLIARQSPADCQHALFPVLEYVSKRQTEKLADYISKVNSKLGEVAWLPGLCDQTLYPARRVFFRNARQYEPYISEIPRSWAVKVEPVLTLFNVQKSPGTEMLVEFISSLDTAPLSKENLGRVISALELLENETDSAILQKLKLPDVHGILVAVDAFTPKDSEEGAEEGARIVRYAHRGVPQSLAIKLNIPQFENDLAHAQYLNGPDIFEVFTQEESLVTRIANQVKESTLWLSLNEYVANAEDCNSASKVTWILDSAQSKYPSKKLFCPELEDWQTPGLYVYNDGIFTEADFEALVNVGMGSKSESSSKIGRYGLGSLTMYLFTDVPTIISGEYFVMFDPQRQYLPFNRSRKRRQAGLRLKLSQMKKRWIDHLTPFIGIGGYTIGTSSVGLTDTRYNQLSRDNISLPGAESQTNRTESIYQTLCHARL
jgi:sacsin